ncbi:MAG: hypothetical protein HZB16_04610 [Armatimonadetes bacterium]|nr:hypothetical protein [Armatimonadota bacterium]
MSTCTLRSYEPGDRQAVTDIQLATLCMGQPLPFPVQDIEVLLGLFTDYFVECEPELAHVAIDPAGRVAGYLLCALHPEREDAWRRTRLMAIARLWARRWRRYDAFTRLYYRLRLRDTWEVIRHPEPALPAVCHWNMLPHVRSSVSQQMQWQTATACLAHGVDYYGGGLTVAERHLKTAWKFVGGEMLASAPHHTLTVLTGQPIYRITLRIDARAILTNVGSRPPEPEVAPARA